MDDADARLPQLRRAAGACRDYIDRLAELCGAAVDVVSIGPDREHTLVRRELV